jgi:transposase
MPRKQYTRYSREFKLEAVRQAALGEKPKAQIARALGIRVGHLRDWRLQFEEEARTGISHPPPAVGHDLEQLRRENAKLKVENEILKICWSLMVASVENITISREGGADHSIKRPSTSRAKRSEVRVH